MGPRRGPPGTVVGAMADPTEPPVADETGPDDPAPRRGRSLDRRTVAICVVLGVAAALLTALAASALLGDDDPTGGMELKDARGIDTGQLLAQAADTRDGGTRNLGSFLDEQPMLVNFWASSCVPCLKEMPLLEQASKDNADVTFVGVATLDRPEQAEKLAKQTGVTYPWVLDPTGEVAYAADGTSLPTTLLLSADGDVIDSHVGTFHTQDEVQAFVDKAG